MAEQTDLKPTTIPNIQNRKKEHKDIISKRVSELGLISWIPGIRRMLNPLFRSNLAKDLRIENLREETKNIPRTDALTQIPNDTAFYEKYSQEVARAKRTGHPIVLGYGDIDGFKGINDIHGHEIGDQALRAVAKALKNGLRTYDTTARVDSSTDNQSDGLASRLHGDEFAFLLPDTSLDNFGVAWNRLKQSLSELRIDTPNGPITGIQMSIGAILIDPTDSAQASLEKADKLMYQSKKEGLGNLHVPVATIYK